MQNPFQSEEDSDFGPGTALVLSLFAVLLLVAAMGWRDALRGRSALPKRIMAISEGTGGQSFFKAGHSELTQTAQKEIAEVVRQATGTARAQRQAGEQAVNHFQVIGYASPEGRQNPELAERRAKAVRDYLVIHLGVPDECVVVANYSDSHSPTLRQWLLKGNSLPVFRKMPPSEQRKALGVGENEWGQERRVEILGVYHTDSTCRLDLVRVRP